MPSDRQAYNCEVHKEAAPINDFAFYRITSVSLVSRSMYTMQCDVLLSFRSMHHMLQSFTLRWLSAIFVARLDLHAALVGPYVLHTYLSLSKTALSENWQICF